MRIYAVNLPIRSLQKRDGLTNWRISGLEIAPKTVVNGFDSRSVKPSENQFFILGKRWWKKYESLTYIPKSVHPFCFYCKIDDAKLIMEQQRLEKESRVHRWSSKMAQMWHKWGQADQKTWKHRTWAFGMRVLNQISWEEWFLKSIPAHLTLGSRVTLYYPANHQPELVSKSLAELLEDRVPYHQKRFRRTLWLLPLTGIIAIVGPNFPLFINLFRVWSHYKAANGGRWLQDQISRGQLECTSSPELEDCRKQLVEITKANSLVPEERLTPDMAISRAVKTRIEQLDADFIRDKEFSEHYMRAYLQTRSRIRTLIYKESQSKGQSL